MSNEILKFADTATNILTQAEYAADAERNTGNVPGVARSKLVNKVLRQCAFISNAFAEYLVSRVGGDVLDDNDSAALLAKIQAAFTFEIINDNFIINGNFDFWQRNTTFAVASSNTYTADRWVDVLAGSTTSITRQATALTESFMAKYFLRSSVTSVVGVANFNHLQQRIEDVRRLANRSVTISFWAKADSARNMSIEMIQNFGTTGSPSAEVTTLGVEKVALTTSWQKFTKTVTLPSISGKVIGTDANSYTGLNFWFDAGANYNSRTDSLGQQSGTFDIAQVKVEEGTNATAFVLANKTNQGELAACQRYYEKSYDLDVVPGSSTLTGIIAFPNSDQTSANYTSVSAMFKSTKRAIPTISYWDAVGNASRATTFTGGGLSQVNNNNIIQTGGAGAVGMSSFRYTALATGGAWANIHFTADAEL